MAQSCSSECQRRQQRLSKSDSWVVGTWLCRRDWLAVRLTEVYHAASCAPSGSQMPGACMWNALTLKT